MFSRFPKKKLENSLIGPRNDFSKIAIFQWFLLIKTIETCFDHREAKSAIRTILQIFPPSEFHPLEEKHVQCKRSVHSGFNSGLLFVLLLFERVL